MSHTPIPSDLDSPIPLRRTRRGSGRTTLADVARVAGVSAQTVSRVLNSPETVPVATLEHVRAAIAQVRYVPNRLAGGLASGRSKLVAALVPAIASPVFQETIQALTQSLASKGYQLMLGESGYDDADEIQLLENLISRGPDGIVLTRVVQSELARQRLASSGIPVVETWDLTDTPVDMLIGFSHEDVGSAVADILLDRGCQAPALISGDDPRARRRRTGFVNRLIARGCIGRESDLPVVEISAPAHFGDGRRAFVALMDKGCHVDGLHCSTDALALGALIEARERNIAVPDQLAVVGFGDQVTSAYTSPALTTVRIDGRRMGQLAAQLILERAEGKPVSARIQNVGFEVVQRASA
jgi:LacI family gluconate utilization system Gnt-I transcriptional repressor